MTFALSGKGYWNSTIKLCEATIAMLSACENQDLYLVDTALEHLQNLVRHGRTLENLKNYKPTTTQVSSSSKKPSRSNRPMQMNPHWIIKDETTVDISLPDHSHITAKTISNEDQLKSIIPIIKQTRCFSIDCEFLALKKNQPRLKVLQIAVSKTEGYAIMIDHFQDIGTIRDVLGEVLEDDSILRIGWAVRADAQAIENSVPGIQLGRILDLQSLVFEDAVETMNLSNAMNRYAPSWEGLTEFQYAKEMGNSFSFTDAHCIWLQQPLPHQALVYAVFDVVSLFALHQQLGHLKVKDEYYWPANVISKLSDKALQKWYINRAYIPPEPPRTIIRDEDVISLSDSYSSTSPVTINSGSSKSKMKARYDTGSGPSTSSLSPATNESPLPDDDEAAYLEDMERAKWLSMQDQLHKSSPYFSTGSPSTSASASASAPTPFTTEATKHQRNVVQVEEYSFDNMSVDSANITNGNEDIKFAEDIYEPTRLDHAELPPDTWGEVDTSRTTTNGSWQQQTPTTNTTSPVYDIPAPKLPTSPPAPPSPRQTDTAKWANTAGVAYTDRNTGSMINSTPTNDEAGWQLFVQQSQNSWQKGIDSSMQDYDLKVKKFAGAQQPNDNTHNNSPTGSPSQARRFNTMAGPTAFNQWSGVDGWETAERQPDTMTMALSGFKARKTHGPKVVNIYDFDTTGDTESESDDEDAANDKMATSTIETTSASTNGLPAGRKSSTSSQDTTDMDTFRDYYHMHDDRGIALHEISRPEHVNLLTIPSKTTPLTISIAVQFHSMSRGNNLLAKGLSIYTSNDHSYTIALDRICAWADNDGAQLRHSNLGKLLTDPTVRRISWRHPFFKDALNEKLGFEIGPVVDISCRLLPEEQKLPMPVVLDKYIGGWPGLQPYKDARADVEEKEKASSRKFGGSIWDKATLSDTTLIFSAAQGAMLHALDQALN